MWHVDVLNKTQMSCCEPEDHREASPSLSIREGMMGKWKTVEQMLMWQHITVITGLSSSSHYKCGWSFFMHIKSSICRWKMNILCFCSYWVKNIDLCYTDPINYYIFLQLSFSPILHFWEQLITMRWGGRGVPLNIFSVYSIIFIFIEDNCEVSVATIL